MNSEAPKAAPAASPLEFDEPTADATGVRKIVRSTLDVSGYPPRAERSISLDQWSTHLLANRLEIQLDSWSDKKMLKTEVFLGVNKERQEIAEQVLKECEAKGKIYGFIANEGGDKVSYTIYYRHRNP